MSRLATPILCFGLAAVSPAAAQWSGSFGPGARTSSLGALRQTSAEMATTIRHDAPASSFVVGGSIDRRKGETTLGTISAAPSFFTSAIRGVRVVGSAEYEKESPVGGGGVSLRATSALSYRRGAVGGWAGYSHARDAGGSLVSGLWRQIGGSAVLSVVSTARRGSFGGRPAHFWTETRVDSIYTDTSGWQRYTTQRTFGDSGVAGRRLTWAETEARLGWSLGRVALDGVVGFRPAIDTSKRATWMRGFATVALARNVALSLGAGTTTRQLPYARSTGRFGLAAVRFAPAALVRPRRTPEITPAASAFSVSRDGDGEYVVRVRLPQARVVELSGDFNGWQPVRLVRDKGDVWRAVLVLAPGTYRMNLRVDGERWTAPPGTPTVEDEFNGRVGLIVIR